MDAAVIYDYLPLFRQAAGLTARLGFLGIGLAFAIGMVCAAVRFSKVPVLKGIVSAYIEISRNTPLLIQLFFL